MTTTTDTKVSKMSIAKGIWADMKKDGYKLPEGKQIRGHFIDRCMAEAGLTPAGAGTYYLSMRKMDQGQPLYYKAKKAAPAPVVDTSNIKVDGNGSEPAQADQGQSQPAEVTSTGPTKGRAKKAA